MSSHATSAVDVSIDARNTLQHKAIDLKERIQNKLQQIQSGVIKKSTEIVEKIACPGFIPSFLNPACFIEKKTEQLTQEFIDAQNFINGLQSQADELTKEAGDAEAAVEKATAAKAQALATVQANLADKAVQFGLDAAGPTLEKLQDLAGKRAPDPSGVTETILALLFESIQAFSCCCCACEDVVNALALSTYP